MSRPPQQEQQQQQQQHHHDIESNFTTPVSSRTRHRALRRLPPAPPLPPALEMKLHLADSDDGVQVHPVANYHVLPTIHLVCTDATCGWRGSESDAAITSQICPGIGCGCCADDPEFVCFQHLKWEAKMSGWTPSDAFFDDEESVIYEGKRVSGMMSFNALFNCPRCREWRMPVRMERRVYYTLDARNRLDQYVPGCMKSRQYPYRLRYLHGAKGRICPRPCINAEEMHAETNRFYKQQLHLPAYQQAGLQFELTSIQKVHNHSLNEQFEGQVEADRQSGLSTQIRRVYHGTCGNDEAFESITTRNLNLPTRGNKTATDGYFGNLWFGAGAYFSQHPDYCFKYAVNLRAGERIVNGFHGKIIVFDILPGKEYRMNCVQNGIPCKDGFHSHRSPSGFEYVLFDKKRMCPRYVITWKAVRSRGSSFVSSPEHLYFNFPQPLKSTLGMVITLWTSMLQPVVNVISAGAASLWKAVRAVLPASHG